MKYFSAAFSAVCSMMFLGITPVWTPMAHAQGSVSFGGLDSFLEENQLEEATKRYTSVLVSFYPEQATRLGFTGANDKLNVRTAQQSAMALAALYPVKTALEKINLQKISDSKRLDYALLLNAVNTSIWEEEQNRFLNNPLYYAQALESVYDLLLQPKTNPAQLRLQVKARLAAWPTVAEQAEKNLRNPSAFLAKLAMDKTYNAQLAADSLEPILSYNMTDEYEINEQKRLIASARQSADKLFELFKKFSEQENSQDFRLGEETYSRLLDLHYQYHKPLEQLLADTDKYLQETQATLSQTMKPFLERARQGITAKSAKADNALGLETLPSLTPETSAEKNGSENASQKSATDFWVAARPLFMAEIDETPLLTIQRDAAEAQNFLVAQGTLPPAKITFTATELPLYYAYFQPYVFRGGNNQPAFFLRVPAGPTALRQEIFDQDFNAPARKILVSSQLVPGAYYRVMQGGKDSTVRRLYPAKSLVNGWIAYAKQLAKDEGYLSSDEDLLFFAWDEYRQALAAWTDVRLHARRLTLDEAQTVLTNLHGFSTQQADDMLAQIAEHPGYAVSYVTGKMTLENLHQKFRKKMKKSFKEADFNAWLFQTGNILPDSLEGEITRLSKAASLK